MKKILAVFSFLLVFSILTACNLGVKATPSGGVVVPPLATATRKASPVIMARTLVPMGGSSWPAYLNYAYGFVLFYPAGGGGIQPGATNTAVRIQLPFTAGTNLLEKYLDINVQVGQSTCGSPEAKGQNIGSGTNLTINGLNWIEVSFAEGAAGSLYQATAYSTTGGSVCVSLTFVLHSANLGNYSTPPPAFNQAAESSIFPYIVETFAWLTGNAVTPTQTPLIILAPWTRTPTTVYIRRAVPTATPTSRFIVIPVHPITLPTATPTVPQIQ